jgi:energy-coupling factor transport system permease protein
VTLLRDLQIDSPIRRLWAGTKLLCVAALSITLSYFPSWLSIGVTTTVFLSAVLLGRIPAGAWPRPPRWFWIMLVVTGGLSSMAGGSPYVHVGGAVIGLGGIDNYSKFVGIGILLLLLAAVMGWTTPLGEIAPALSKLMRPLRWLKVPVDELAVAVALCVRSLPLLVSELRTLIAARRLRPAPARPDRTSVDRWLDELVDLLVAALAVSVRRSGELAEAITARGGIGLVAARVGGPGWSDLVALGVVVAACVAAPVLAP